MNKDDWHSQTSFTLTPFTGFPLMILPFNRSLVGARVERISSARAPEMCPFENNQRKSNRCEVDGHLVDPIGTTSPPWVQIRLRPRRLEPCRDGGSLPSQQPRFNRLKVECLDHR
jgi:hypothetical protein